MSRETDIVDESLTEFAQLQVYRNVFASQWEEVAQIVAPNQRNTFYYGSYNFPGEKKTDRQVDSTAMLALRRFAAILDSMLTPQNSMWHYLRAEDDELMKNRAVALYFDKLTRIIFKYRYDRLANFAAQNQGVYGSLGAFGNGILLIDELRGPRGEKGLRYRNNPLGEMFFRENFQGLIDGFCRWFRLTKQQAIQQFGKENLPQGIVDSSNPQQQFDFLHRLCPRNDYDPQRLDEKGKPWASYYIAIQGRKLLSEGGETSFPCAITRYQQLNGVEVYGRGPAMDVLPSIKTLNSQKTDFLTQGHMAVDPVYLTTDDGIVDWDRRPGALNKGGVGLDGTKLVQRLETGDINISLEMMQEEAKIIEGAFLTDLFKILLDDPKVYNATQVVEMMSQRGVLLAPTIGRQQSEYIGPTVDRELDVLGRQGLLPPMPPQLREAGGLYKVQYASPLARSMRAQELAGLNRSVERSVQIAQATGDPTPLFYYDWSTIIPEAADIDAVPAHWMASPQDVAQKVAAHQAAMKAQQQIQAAPAAAAMQKADAVSQKNAGGGAPMIPQGQGPQQ